MFECASDLTFWRWGVVRQESGLALSRSPVAIALFQAPFPARAQCLKVRLCEVVFVDQVLESGI